MDNIFLSELGVVLGAQPANINLDASFVYNGGHSLSAAALITKCKAQGFTIKFQTLMISPSLKEVMAATVEIPGHKVMKSSAKQIFQISEPSPPLSAADKGQQDDFLEAVPSLQNGTSKAPSREDKRNQYHGGTVDHPVTNQGLQRFDIAKAYQLPLSPALTPKLSSKLISEDYPDRVSSPIQTLNFEDGSFTEMQLSLMHGSMKTPGMNVITHAETFHSKEIPLMKLAWKMVIEQEPIFCIKALLPEDGRSFYWYDPQINKDEFSLDAFITLSRDHVCSTFEVAHQEPLHTPHSLSKITWRVHHALIDGFSAYLLFDKVRQVASGRFVKPSPPFSDTVQDLKRLQESQRKDGNAFWAKKNEQNPSAKSNLLLHSMDEQLEHEKSQSAEVVLDMRPVYEKLVVFAREMNVTSATIFNAAWVLVLSSYADSDTVVFGAVLSGRDLPILNAASVIGPLVNMLPFFVTINREDTVHQFLRTVYEEMVELREYQWTTPENGFSRDFDSALVVQSDQPALDNGFVQAIGRPQTQQATSTPLTVIVEGDGTVHFNYHYRRFNRQNIERVSSYFYETIRMLMRTSTTIEIILMGLMPATSQKLLMENGNCLSGLTTRTSVDQDLVTLFESRVRKHPDDIAVERGQDYLTYQQFDEAATKVMSRLKTKIMPGDVVCVHSDRSINWIVAIFGILKAEGIYCSLSNDLPVELRNTMYQSAGAKVYLTPDISQEESCPDSCDACWAIDTILEEEPTSIDAKELHRKQPIPWATAYLCFTSGSTGTPKGVMCTHEGLVAFQSDLVVRLLAQPGIKISQIMSPAFDGSIHEIFSTLTYGATLVLQVDGDPFGHLGLVDSAILTPSMARILDPRDFKRLSTVSNAPNSIMIFLFSLSQSTTYIHRVFCN